MGTSTGKRGIVVHGMSRSGTSAVAGMFARAGFFVGEVDDLVEPSEFNRHGHYERWDVVRANEHVLGQARATWFEPPPRPMLEALGAAAREPLADRLEQIVGASQGRPIALKDPRIDVLMPLWGPLLRDRFGSVLVLRNPVEIALSLQRRDATPLPFALAAWELHMTELLGHLDGQSVTIVPYARVACEPALAVELVAAIARDLDPETARYIESAQAQHGIDPALRNHSVEGEALEDGMLSIHQRELWRMLDSLAPGPQRLSLPAEMLVASAHARVIAHAETQRAWDAAQQAKIVEALESERARYAQLLSELGEARRYAAEVTAAFEQALATLAAITGSASWRVTAPLRVAKRGVAQIRR